MRPSLSRAPVAAAGAGLPLSVCGRRIGRTRRVPVTVCPGPGPDQGAYDTRADPESVAPTRQTLCATPGRAGEESAPGAAPPLLHDDAASWHERARDR
jgi:hypothetical protein